MTIDDLIYDINKMRRGVNCAPIKFYSRESYSHPGRKTFIVELPDGTQKKSLSAGTINYFLQGMYLAFKDTVNGGFKISTKEIETYSVRSVEY